MNNRRKTIVIPLLVLVAISLTGCDVRHQVQDATLRQTGTGAGSSSTVAESRAGITSGKRGGLPEVIKAGKVEFRVGEGDEVFSFKPKDDGTACKLHNASDEEICKLSFADNKLKVKTADDQPLFELKAKDDKLMIKDATGESELFKLKFKGDRIDFYKPNDVRVNRIKKQDYGWRLEDNADNTLFRAKSHEGKMVLRDLEDKTVLYSKDIPGPLGLMFFRIEELSFEQQAACCVFLLDR